MATPQPLHIFQKDLRHLWPETLIVILLFVAFAACAPSGWTSSPYAGVATLVAGLLKVFLMPISWLVVISRLIHDEPLVGDRQFWTSRPYHWAKLLAAKVLFLIVFIYLPFLIMQVYLLRHAGLYPSTVLGPLLHNLLLLTVILIVPITAIAAVTSTFVKLLLSAVGAILYMLVLSGLLLWFAIHRMSPPALTPVFIGIFILLPLIALIYQYATRRTLHARIMLVATPLLIVILLLLTPASALIRQQFPVATASTDPKLSGLPDVYRPKAARPGRLRTQRDEVELTLPFTIENMDKDSNFIIQGVSATIDIPGTHWASPYNSVQGQQMNSSSPVGLVSLTMPLDIFNKVRLTPADVHLSLATSHMKLQSASTWKATLLPFSVPGHGLCSYSNEDPDQPPTCRYAFKMPDLNFVTAPLAAASCTQPAAPPVQGQTSLGVSDATLDFDPVVTVPLTFPTRDPNPQHHYLLCPGTPLTFIEAKTEGRARFELDEKQLILDAYAARIASPQQQPLAIPGLQPDAPQGPASQ